MIAGQGNSTLTWDQLLGCVWQFWNAASPSIKMFKRELKTHLFKFALMYQLNWVAPYGENNASNLKF